MFWLPDGRFVERSVRAVDLRAIGQLWVEGAGECLEASGERMSE